MSDSELIAKLKNELTALEYTPVGIGNYCAYARQFLEYLASRQIALTAVTPGLVAEYLDAARKERERRRSRALGPTWQSIPRAGIHTLLRLTLGKWPPEPELVGPEATLRHAICSSYEMWLREEKGLADASISALLWEGRHFLEWQLDRCGVDGLVRDLGMRTELACTVYLQILGSFQMVAERYAIIDRSTLKAWLSDRARYWSPSTMAHHARVVDRFLSYLVGEAVIAANPIDVLRTDYQIRTRRSIWRALATTNPDATLAALRRPKPFGSVLGAMMRDHIALMRNRGYRYATQATWCLRFDRHLQAHPDLASQPMEVMLESWRAARSTHNHAAECERLEGILAKALRHKDPALKIRRPNPKPLQEVARHWRRPHIYSPADVRRMLDLARSYPSPRAPLRPLTIYTMLLLAYCAGLRRSEIARLDLGDVELGACTITIRETKFFKTRILPLSESVMVELVAYMDARRRAGSSQDPGSGLFWHEQGTHRYTPTAVAWLLVDVLRRAELKPLRGKIGPRLHDLRHSMVVNRILEWYRAGINPQDRLPFLATYMGHRDIHSTLVYITVTQDLLQEASERFRVLGAPCLTLTQEGRP